jgi:FMN phosphatase YigB (HAD superfamily)
MGEDRIRNLIFDFGGVIIDIDFQRTINAFIKLGAENFEENYSKANQSGIFDELDKGKVSQKKFVDSLKPLLPSTVGDEDIINAWNEIIIGVPEKRIRLIESLKKNYHTFLLSNTNSIHYDLYMPEIKHRYGYALMEDLFEGVYLSFRLGMRKPNREIFDFIFTTQNLEKQETLFIDDSIHIIDAARSYGIRSFWLKDGMDVCDLFENGKLNPGLL